MFPSWGTQLPQLEEQAALDLRVVSLRLTLGREIFLKIGNFLKSYHLTDTVRKWFPCGGNMAFFFFFKVNPISNVGLELGTPYIKHYLLC